MSSEDHIVLVYSKNRVAVIVYSSKIRLDIFDVNRYVESIRLTKS